MARNRVKKAVTELPLKIDSLNSENGNDDIPLGSKLVIESPSSSFYQYVHESLDFQRQSLSDLEKLLAVKDAIVTITGFLTMADGELIAVAQVDGKKGKGPLFAKLFIALQNAFDANEISRKTIKQ